MAGMTFSNGFDTFGLSDMFGAMQTATNIQVAGFDKVIKLATDTASSNISMINQARRESEAILKPYVDAGMSGTAGLKSYINQGLNANNALAAFLGVQQTNTQATTPYSQYKNELDTATKAYETAKTNSDQLQEKFSNAQEILKTASPDSNEYKVALDTANSINANGAYAGSALSTSLNRVNQASAAFNTYQQNNPNDNQAAQPQQSNADAQQSQMQALNNMLNSPMIQSQMKFGLDATQNRMAAQGLTGSGNSLAGLQDYSQALAAGHIGEYMQGLQSMSGQGSQAASQLANVGGNAAAGTASIVNNAATQSAAIQQASADTQSNAIMASSQVQAQNTMAMAQMSMQMAGASGMSGYGGGGGLGLFGF